MLIANEGRFGRGDVDDVDMIVVPVLERTWKTFALRLGLCRRWIRVGFSRSQFRLLVHLAMMAVNLVRSAL